jgi:uncharacterized protein (TIGR00730 family)
MPTLRRLCVFCGSSDGVRPEYRAAAAAFGRLLAERGLELIYGGGRVGLMGALADGCLAAGGRVVGVIPQSLMAKELGHGGCSELHVVDSMHTRKALMSDRADAFVALPGGIGTFEELFEVWTWSQLGLHQKPCGMLNVASFYDPLLEFLRHAADDGFMRREHLDMLAATDDALMLLDRLAKYEPPDVAKWIERRER